MGAPEVFLVCQGCLSDDRRCNVIEGSNLNVFLRILDPEGDCKAGKQEINCLFLCWECDAILRKIRKFQLKVQKAKNVLKKVYLPNLKSQCLSTLKTITKTQYDADINTSLQFKEITILKIGADGKPISDNLSKNNNVFSNSENKDFQFEVNLNNSPINYGFSDNDYDNNNSDHISDDTPIIDFISKKKKLKKSLKKEYKKSVKAERSEMPPLIDPLVGRPKRKKKPIEKLDIMQLNEQLRRDKPKKKRPPPKKVLPDPKKMLPAKGTRSRPANVKNDEPPPKKWLIIDAGEEEKDNDLPDVEAEDPTFVAPYKIKTNHSSYDENSKYTKTPINKEDLLQYFTKYTLSVTEYREFLERLSKTPYFMSLRRKCDKCVVTFRDEDDYKKHMDLHIPNGGYSCSLCDLYFLDQQQYHQHTSSHLTVHQCNICKHTCGLQHSLATHIVTVHRDGFLYKCQACAMMFESRSAVCQHFDKLHKRLVCNECGKFQYSKKTMAMHYQSKHVPPMCPHCNRIVKNYAYLRTHLILRHNYPEKKKCKLEDMYCVECDKQFNSMLKFRTHTSTVHRPDKTPIKVECKVCGKMITKSFLRTHHDFYHGEPRFKCDICNRAFAKKESMQRHIGVFHLGQRPVKDKPCYICGRLFTTNRILTHHIRTHTGEKPYSCDYCPATFAQKAAKYIHYKNVHKRRLDNTSVEAVLPIGDPAMSMMVPCSDSYSVPSLGMEMSLVRPGPDCGVNVCHSVLSGGH